MISRFLLLHPFRRTALCRLDQASNGDGAGKVPEDVNVIFHAIDEDGLTADILKRARHVGVQAGAEFRVFEKGNAVLRAEYDMQDDAGEGLRHKEAGLLRPVGALTIPYFQTQGTAPVPPAQTGCCATTAGRKVLLIVDNLKVHHSRLVKEWLCKHKAQIEVFYLPSYSPERNPDEYLNGDLKASLGNKRPPRDRQPLEANLKSHMHRLTKLPNHVGSYFQNQYVRYAA